MATMKPMLAVEAEDFNKLTYPLLASYKLDGIRCLITKEGPRTRSLKPVPNKFIAEKLATLPVGLDGEIVIMDGEGKVDFRATTSAVMARKGEPKFEFHVFDLFNSKSMFGERSMKLVDLRLPKWVTLVNQMPVGCAKDIHSLFKEAIADGYEGLILRSPEGPYKFGRATLKSQWMLKVKPWKDAEARVVAITEACENTNEATTNELGRTKRSSAKAGKVPKGTLGSLVVSSPKWPKDFEIGTGFTEEEAQLMWADKKIVGKTVRFAYVDAGGYDVPRHCSFQGFRDERDT